MADSSEKLRFISNDSPDTEELRERLLQRLVSEKFASRLSAHDAELFGAEAAYDARVRMNWVNAPMNADALLKQAADLVQHFSLEPGSAVVLCGMGGSSLGPRMLTQTLGGSLTVLDTTAPDDIAEVLAEFNQALFIVSSKSGTTVETRSHLAIIEQGLTAQGIRPAGRILVITDPDTELAAYAAAQGYQTVHADPNVGGRYSIFTAFGVIPAALAGTDLRDTLREARDAHTTLFQNSSANPALQLAASAVSQGFALYMRDHVGERGLAAWVEQLVAESTGKNGVGLLPVVLLGSEDLTGQQANTAELLGPLGAKLLCWEVATTAMSWLLGVNPFDQPDVERSKMATRELLRGDNAPTGELLNPGLLSAADAVSAIRDSASHNGYVALQYFGSSSALSELRELRSRLEHALALPVTFGLGPAYLHSTGQLHKGGPGTGVFLQILAASKHDIPIPGESYTFGSLLGAQAEGDASVLEQLGRPVFRTAATLTELADQAASLL